MHIPPHDNHNRPIVDVDDARVPLNYFNIVKLKAGQSFEYQVPGYETAIVPATGTRRCRASAANASMPSASVALMCGMVSRRASMRRLARWCRFVCTSESAEVFVAGARFDGELTPFAVRAADIDKIQYGSDDTKTHRKIKHILGTKYHGRVGRLLVSELFTVGQGGWSGFPPHKHDTDRLPLETRHDETYNFRFRPNHGFGLQLVQREDGKVGDAYHLMDGSTVVLEKGYHPCVAAPGYEMYYFTILGGLSQRSLVQFFQPTHAYQVETIPGIKDMIAKFK